MKNNEKEKKKKNDKGNDTQVSLRDLWCKLSCKQHQYI